MLFVTAVETIPAVPAVVATVAHALARDGFARSQTGLVDWPRSPAAFVPSPVEKWR